MPVLLPLLVPFLVMLAAVAVLALHQTENAWLRPLLESLTHPKGSFLKRVALAPVASLFAGVLYVEKHVRSVLSHYAAGSLAVPVKWMNAQAHLWAGMAYEAAHVAEDAALSLAHLRHHTMPRYVKGKVAPVAAVAAGAEVLGRRSISEGKTLRIRTGKSIDRLRKQAGLLAGILLGIDILVKERHAHRHHHDHTHTLPKAAAGVEAAAREAARLGKTVAKHQSLLRRLAKLLTIAGFGALLWRVLLKWKLGWLRCSKVGQVGRALCGIDQLLIDALLLEIGVLSTPFSIEQFTRLMATPTRELLGGLHYLVSEIEEFTTAAEGVWTKGSTANPVPDL